MKINNIIKLVGKKNYERLKKDKIEDYVFEIGEKELINLLKDSEDKDTNLYKDYRIQNKYSPSYLEGGRQAKTRASIDGLDIPEIIYHKNITKLPKAEARNIIGHELGHANAITEIKLLQIKLAELKKEPIKNQGAIKKLNTLIEQKRKQYFKNSEANADKNISKYLKQMGIPKGERRAHYYIRKNIYPNREGRYQSKLGNLKYLKDYIFGFSNLPEEYYLYKPLSTEWRQAMQQYFYSMFYNK